MSSYRLTRNVREAPLKKPQKLSQIKDIRRASQLDDESREKAGDSHCLTFSVEEAARILGISRGTAYALARHGSLPTIRLGRRLLVPKAGLEKMLSVV